MPFFFLAPKPDDAEVEETPRTDRLSEESERTRPSGCDPDAMSPDDVPETDSAGSSEPPPESASDEESYTKGISSSITFPSASTV